jgi:hypothetical protein
MNGTGRPEMFRAGLGDGEHAASARLDPGTLSGPQVLLADISEYQPDISDAAYLAWSKAIVIRAMYGDAHDDNAWYGGARRSQLLAGGCRFLGIYQYIVAGQDITAQARAFCRLLGHLNPGEYPVADIEEGSGSQLSRWQTWAHVVYDSLGFSPGDYSGEHFADAHGLAPVDWVAAYQASEPAVPHLLWQFTDNFQVPGVGPADCSVFHGTMDQLAAHAYGGTVPKPPPPEPPPPVVVPVSADQEDDMPTLQFSDAGTATVSFVRGQYHWIGFAKDWSVRREDQPVVRIAVHSNAKGWSQIVNQQGVPQTGKLGVEFAEPDVDYLSVVLQGGNGSGIAYNLA